MNALTVDPVYLVVGLPAMVFGLLVGLLIMWLVGRGQQARLQNEREAAFELANAKLTQTFADLASRSLKANSDNFLLLAEENLGKQHEKAKRELSEREKAVEALRRPEVRGRWGEITLRRLVELAGMVEHCDFMEQVHKEGNGQVIRPDMVVRMPEQRVLVVDVKTPLDAYLSAAEAQDDNERQVCLKRHARNVRTHIRLLSSKAYWNQFDESPEFVILFIPGDQFLSAALSEEPDLIEYALSKQIILATPTSFVALLKAVAYGWRQLALADNAQEIRVLAEDLYGRLATFVSHMNKVGRQLASSVDHYNKAVGSLERSVLPGARKFVELGVRSKKEVEKLEILESTPRTMVEGDDS